MCPGAHVMPPFDDELEAESEEFQGGFARTPIIAVLLFAAGASGLLGLGMAVFSALRPEQRLQQARWEDYASQIALAQQEWQKVIALVTLIPALGRPRRRRPFIRCDDLVNAARDEPIGPRAIGGA